ncbi:hypothetical protein V8F20_004056 [Naviculisporaceae sp. PSN 640]
MSHKPQLPSWLRPGKRTEIPPLRSPTPPTPPEKHDCRNTIIKCLRDQISQLKHIVELQRLLKMGSYPDGDPRGIEDTIVSTLTRVEAKIEALFRMVNGIRISVSDLKSEVRGNGGQRPARPWTSTQAKGSDSSHTLFPIRESSSRNGRGEDMTDESTSCTWTTQSGSDTVRDASTNARGITKKRPAQKKSNIDSRDSFSNVPWGVDDEVIPATNYANWTGVPEPKHDAASRTNNDDWFFGDNGNSHSENPPASAQNDDDWEAEKASYRKKQRARGQRNNGWGEEQDNSEKTIPASFYSDWTASNNQLDPKQKRSTESNDDSSNPFKHGIGEVVLVVSDEEDKPQKEAKERRWRPVQVSHPNNSTTINKSKKRNKNKWAATVETDKDDSDGIWGDPMPGGWPESQDPTQSQHSQAKSESSATPKNKDKPKLVRVVTAVTSNPVFHNRKKDKGKKEMHQESTWENNQGDEVNNSDWGPRWETGEGDFTQTQTDDWGSTWESNNQAPSTSIVTGNETIENDNGNETEWLSTQPWSDDESDDDGSDDATLSPGPTQKEASWAPC